MWIVTSSGTSLLDTGYVERFCLAEKPDAVLIVASYSAERIVTIGRYADKREATEALMDLYAALAGDTKAYTMPDSTMFHPELKVKDARTKRRGGS